LNKNTQGILIISFVLLFVATALAFKYTVTSNKLKYNLETLCPNCDGYPIVRVFIDKTDIWDEDDKKQLNNLLHKIKNDLSIYEQLIIYVLDESGNKQVFNMCNPGNGDQANSLYENPRKIKAKFDQQFSKPLDSIITSILNPNTAARSPLIEVIQELSPATKNDRLFIVSDLMQNSDIVSFYKDVNSWASKSFSKKTTVDKDIKYSSVNIYFIDRSNLKQKTKDSAISFWNNHLKQIAYEVSIRRLKNGTNL